LVQNLLKIAKFDVGIIQFEMADVSVREVLIQVVEEFDTRCKREGKSIELIDNGEVTLHCDSLWMTEAISNIVKNALDHMNNGGSVTLGYMETPIFIRIKITDLGEGIHPEDIHNIFKRFYRSRFSKDTQGAGLGLPLANMITEAHNGTITVESELGRGSSFQLDFMKENGAMQGIRKHLTKV
jgi:signal transduction histidine kinase